MIAEFAELFSPAFPIGEKSISLAQEMEASKVKRLIAVNEFIHEDTSTGIFLMRQNSRMRELAEALPNMKMRIIPTPCVRISRGVSHTSDLHKLTLNKTGYILTSPPYGGFSDEIMLEYRNLIINEKLVPVIMYFERCVAGYDDYNLNRIIGISSAVFQISGRALVDVKLRKTVESLLEDNRTVIISDNRVFDKKKKKFSLTAPSRKLYEYLIVKNNSFYLKIF
ncbi:MAG: hypothetical protein SOZ62_04135 [Eubacteriales bacterium]|nr:hypothetical protein [Eubacteriales bacterium]